ncbi:hypothetical protein ACLKA7_008450 [Drosophila subpalustris]
MASMLWDEELAYFARINVRECIQHRDLCRNTAKYKHVGQTVVYRAVNSLNRPDGLKNIIFRMMSKWSKWSKSIGGVMMNIRNYTYDHYAPKETYSQLILENANKVGCAALQMLQNGWRQYFFTCNYAQSPIVGKPIYSGIFGHKPANPVKPVDIKNGKIFAAPTSSKRTQSLRMKLKFPLLQWKRREVEHQYQASIPNWMIAIRITALRML